MEPLYFGKKSGQLFGVYHPPSVPTRHEIGVVLCYPILREYMYTHHAHVQLASALASNGMHALRFDYLGCGDSAGDSTEGTVDQWMDDISVAIDELAAGTGVRRLFLIGCEFGAALAFMAGSRREDISGVVLWEPVIKGRAYIQDLYRQQKVWKRSYMSPPSRQGDLSEILGYPLTDTLRHGIESIDLTALRQPLVRSMLVVESHKTGPARGLVRALGKTGMRVIYKHVPAKRGATGLDGTQTLMNLHVFQHVRDWLLEERK